MSILVVVGVLVGVAGLLIPRITGGGGDDAERKAVVSRATDFAVTYNTYEVAQKDDYQKRMKGLLTSAYFKQFTTVTDALFEALEGKDQKSGEAKVLGVAVDSIDEDSAVALIAVDASITTSRDDQAVPRRFRWKVSFARQKGEWLVRQFETISPLEATTGDPEATPAPDESSPSAEEGNQ
ncbi:MAG: hypothetical protein ACR2FE_10295 [Aeromicrobium sp.]